MKLIAQRLALGRPATPLHSFARLYRHACKRWIKKYFAAMRKRWIRMPVYVSLALLVAFLAFLLFERVRGQISLAYYQHQLAAKGERLTWKALIPPMPEGENGAPEIFATIQRLETGECLPQHVPPRMMPTPAGRAVVGFRETEWVEGKDTFRWEQLAPDLKANERTLAQIRVALEKPVLNNQLDYSQGFKIPFTHLAPAKSLASWFGPAGQLALHEGKNHEALGHVIALVRLPRLLAEDRLVISELVRISIGAMARVATWEALQATNWTEGDLAVLQKAWESQGFATAMVRSLEGERAYDDTAYELVRKSNKETIEALYGLEDFFDRQPGTSSDSQPYSDKVMKFLKRQVYGRFWCFAWSHQDQRHSLETTQHVLEIARIANETKSLAPVQPALSRLEEEAELKSHYDQWRYPVSQQYISTLPNTVEKAMRAETERSIAICAIALRRFWLRHGKLPPNLAALVPEFLTSVPIDYMDGKPMKYHPNADGTFALYSVGEDGKDDGGDGSLLPDKPNSRNLWWWRDFVWPLPALPEEVEAYRQKAAKNQPLSPALRRLYGFRITS
jgi:hypothetical protein